MRDGDLRNIFYGKSSKVSYKTFDGLFRVIKGYYKGFHYSMLSVTNVSEYPLNICFLRPILILKDKLDRSVSREFMPRQIQLRYVAQAECSIIDKT